MLIYFPLAQAWTVALPDIQVQGTPGVPLWVIILAVLAGIILLFIIVILLWKVSCFSSVGHHTGVLLTNMPQSRTDMMLY